MIYPTADLAAAKSFVTQMLGVEPYFDQPFYVGYQVAGYEFALDPNGDPADGATTYWGVAGLDAAITQLVGIGATVRTEVVDVGDGIRVATLDMPGSGVLGVIENPHFQLQAVSSSGPGR